jgi:hypothetical protein
LIKEQGLATTIVDDSDDDGAEEDEDGGDEGNLFRSDRVVHALKRRHNTESDEEDICGYVTAEPKQKVSPAKKGRQQSSLGVAKELASIPVDRRLVTAPSGLKIVTAAQIENMVLEKVEDRMARAAETKPRTCVTCKSELKGHPK